jgi:lysophospholipase L1-like esterase
MHLPTTLSYISLLATSAIALPSPQTKPSTTKPPYFILAGDSTTAVQSEGGGGWGTGFLTTTLTKGASGHNYGHNGATTVSFRQGGDWATVLSAAKDASKDFAPYVTIQFGHNDQKPDKNISAKQLTANLVAFVNEVKDVGATPILVTSLSRRKYGSDGKIKPDLADVVAAAKDAANETGADIIDLNAASTKYLNQIGAEKAPTYDLKAGDSTHLNAEGSVVFGNLVAMLIKKEVPAVSKYLKPVASVKSALEKGVYIFPKV